MSASSSSERVSGYLHLQPLGYGFLRPSRRAEPTPEDVYVAPSQIARHALANGNFVEGDARPPRGPREHYRALTRVTSVSP